MKIDGNLQGPLGHDFSPVAERLLVLPRERVVFVANPGNAGDNVIATGTFELFRRLSFVPEIGSPEGTYPDAHVIFGGGGNFIELYSDARNFIQRHRGICRSFILLPHTVRGNEDVLKELDERFVLFAREMDTLAHLERHAPRARVQFCHDMAFMNDFSRLPNLLRKPPFRRALPLTPQWRVQARALMRWRRMLLNRSGIRGSLKGRLSRREGVLNAFRTDKERTDFPIPQGNIDLSRHLQFVQDSSPFMSGRIASELVKRMSYYDVVRTNRLHIAITAAMLGKDVEMSDNNYGKLRGVYEASMSEFSNIRLM